MVEMEVQQFLLGAWANRMKVRKLHFFASNESSYVNGSERHADGGAGQM
jgi:hypothetical protein